MRQAALRPNVPRGEDQGTGYKYSEGWSAVLEREVVSPIFGILELLGRQAWGKDVRPRLCSSSAWTSTILIPRLFPPVAVVIFVDLYVPGVQRRGLQFSTANTLQSPKQATP